MLSPCSFITLTMYTESQMYALGLYSGGIIFGRIFGLWGPIFWGLIFGVLVYGILRYVVDTKVWNIRCRMHGIVDTLRQSAGPSTLI